MYGTSGISSAFWRKSFVLYVLVREFDYAIRAC